MIGDWGEVVTRYPYRKVRMDHLLSKEKIMMVVCKSSSFILIVPLLLKVMIINKRQWNKKIWACSSGG